MTIREGRTGGTDERPGREGETRATTWRVRPTAVEWVLLALGLALVNHYAWLLDDAFVFFRYADNFVLLDHGLVYNRGEYVEGFSSPAWMLLLSALRTLRIDWWHAVRLLGVVLFVAFWWMLLRLDRELGPREAAGAARLNFPLVYLSLHYGVLCYFTSGVETPLVQLLALVFAWYLLRPDAWPAAAAVGAAALVRPELGLASVLAVAFAWWQTRRPPWRPLLAGGVAVGGWLIVRVVYYAELLPNTYYLKDLADWRQGLVYLWETVSTYGVLVVAAVFLALYLALRRRGVALRAAPRAAMLVIAAAIALYFVRVGGDPRHYRYLAFSFCLATAALAGLADHGLATFAPGLRSTRGGRLAIGAVGLLLALGVATRHPPQLGAHPIRGEVPHHMVHGINDAAYHRNHPRFRFDPWSLAGIQRALPEPLPGDDYALVESHSWCEWAWRIPGTRVIQNLGLTDPLLARVDLPPDRPAHKSGLQQMARDVVRVHERYTAAPGMYRLAVEQGVAADWIARNLDTIEIVERKIYNRHRLGENLRLAFTFTDRIQP